MFTGWPQDWSQICSVAPRLAAHAEEAQEAIKLLTLGAVMGGSWFPGLQLGGYTNWLNYWGLLHSITTHNRNKYGMFFFSWLSWMEQKLGNSRFGWQAQVYKWFYNTMVVASPLGYMGVPADSVILAVPSNWEQSHPSSSAFSISMGRRKDGYCCWVWLIQQVCDFCALFRYC